MKPNVPVNAAIAAAVVVLAGCGGASEDQRLEIEGQVGHAKVAAGTFCLGVSEGGAGGPGGAEAARIFAQLVRDWPDEKIDGQTVKQHAQDTARQLDDDCGEAGSRYAEQLRDVLQ